MLKTITSTFLALVALIWCHTTMAQEWPSDTISVHINSGNPKFPFPQFTEYAAGKTLAKNNAEGVTHADMEKAMREGYQIMMHRALKTSKTLNGKQYLVFNYPTVPHGYNTFVSEGDGYALLAAAYFADKETFDGLWLWVHDNRLSNVKRYYNCAPLRAAYTYGSGLPGWSSTESSSVASPDINSASDGDADIAMALLMAYKQWGDNMGIDDACGNPISYKKEALSMIKTMVDTLYYAVSPMGTAAGMKGYLSGDVGIDGYQKSGNTWGELTNWRYGVANIKYPWAKIKPDPIQVNSRYAGYIAPSYFNEFGKFLAENGGTDWQINQCKRAEASSDWIMGQMYDKGYIASAGEYSVNDDGLVTAFQPFDAGEDFRIAWRSILNYVWHGNPNSSWSPVTHEVVAGSNTFEYNMAVRHANFVKLPKTSNQASTTPYCGKLAPSPDASEPDWKGVVQIKQQYSPTGSVIAPYNVNWMLGTATPSAVASGDLDLTAELYRQCEIMWDDVSGTSTMSASQRYIQSTPKYFDSWFRMLGMLTTTGNLHAPAQMAPAANLKVYLATNKTVAYVGDTITYTVSYRNYGSVAATGASITLPFSADYQLVSVTNGGALKSNNLLWNIGTIPGFTSSTGIAPTQGTLSFKVKVKTLDETKRVCLAAVIMASNAPIWVSNEYPNNATYTLERNCVDLLKAEPLSFAKTASKSQAKEGDEITYKLAFGNPGSKKSLINGGRSRVNFSYAHYLPNNSTSFYQFYRIWHGAQEAYVNMGNYRITYFLSDSISIGIYDVMNNPRGWGYYIDNEMDLYKYGYNTGMDAKVKVMLNFENVAKSKDSLGKWNQKLSVKFPDALTSPAAHLYGKIDNDYLIHKGVRGPAFVRTRLESNPSSILNPKIADDWSFSTSSANGSLDGQSQRFFPVSPSRANHLTLNAVEPVNNFGKDICNADVANFTKVLVEEFDGYAWRTLAGNAPLYGEKASHVILIDTISKDVSWLGFDDNVALAQTAVYTPAPNGASYTGIVYVSVPQVLLGDTASISYSVKVKTDACLQVGNSLSGGSTIRANGIGARYYNASGAVSCVVTQLSDESIEEAIEIFPNPNMDHDVTIKLKNLKNQVEKIVVRSVEGKAVYSINDPLGPEIVIASSGLNSGVYWVEIVTKEHIYNRKLEIFK